MENNVSYNRAIIIIGIESMKENWTASFLLICRKIHMAIVMPDLDMPGKAAIPCASPISAMWLYFIEVALWEPLVNLSEKKSIVAVTIRQNPIRFSDCMEPSPIKFFMRKAAAAVITVARINL